MAILLPYTFRVLSHATGPTNTGARALSVQVLDRAGSVRATLNLQISATATLAEIHAAIRDRVAEVQAIDAGTTVALLDQLVTDAETFDAVVISGTRKTANQAESGVAFVNVTDLSFLLAPNSHYKFSFTGAYSGAATTTGLQLSVSGPASPAFLAFVAQICTSATASFAGVGGAYDVAVAATASGGATVLPFWLEGSISTGAAGGTFQLRMRSEVNGSAVTINRGSVGELIQVA